MKRAVDIPRLGREVVLEARKLTNPEARFLVSNYYQAQEMRKRSDMQIRHLGDKELPALLQYTADAFAVIEGQVNKALLGYALSTKVGQWCLSHVGIGPVITAGLLAHLSIEGHPTAGHFWRFAGLDPTCKWGKGQKRPWNAELRQLCWHLGQCAKRVSGNERAYYGQLYRSRKEMLVARNDAGHNAERAKTFQTRSAEVRKVLEQGKLPPNNIDSQACNFVAKIFLSHLHGVMYWDHHGAPPPKPFAIAILGHGHEIHIPNVDMFPGFEEAYYGR